MALAVEASHPLPLRDNCLAPHSAHLMLVGKQVLREHTSLKLIYCVPPLPC